MNLCILWIAGTLAALAAGRVALVAWPIGLGPGQSLRTFGRRLCLLTLSACLPSQGMATAIGHIDGVAHVHRISAAARSGSAPAADQRLAPVLPSGMPVLLSVDDLRHGHGASKRRDETRPHEHTTAARHWHSDDDVSVVALADAADAAASPPAGKRVLLDVDTPPMIAMVIGAGGPLACPPTGTARGLPDPGSDRPERPPPTTAS